MDRLNLLLLLTVAAGLAEAKLGEKDELGPRRRRCLDGSLPTRLRSKEEEEGVCPGLYPRVSCCPAARRRTAAPLHTLRWRRAPILPTNNTMCSRLLEEIQCAYCSPNAQMLFHSSKMGLAPHREHDLPRLCKSYCQEFYYTCRGDLPELFQVNADEFCRFYGTKEGSLCFPDFHRKAPHQESNYLLDEQIDVTNRKQKHNCYCAHEVLSSLRQPVAMVHCGDGSQRLFVLEREGFVRILTHEMKLLNEPFLDIHKLVQSGLKAGDERGLLSLAFHPNFKKNGKLYVSYTTSKEQRVIGPHDHILRVAEYTVSRKNPNQVDSRTSRVLMDVAELHRKHLGGQLLFGPDGLLHIILGDGMITLDNMEEMDGLSDFTGSVLRVDVDTDCCSAPYSIPRNNPYFNSTNQPPEIFAHGLHNPGRCAMDRLHLDSNGSLLIICTDSEGRNSTSGRILQLLKGRDYENEQSVFDLGSGEDATPVGGFIYRGCQSRRLYGSYIFADKSGSFRILQKHSDEDSWLEKPLCLGSNGFCASSMVGQVLGFGEDELGEVYVLTSSKSISPQSHSGKLYKLVDPKRPQVPKECKRPVVEPEMLSTACSRQCKNGHCSPTGRCCCVSGWDGPFCSTATCEPACQNGGVCEQPNSCLCKDGFLGAQCQKSVHGPEPSDAILEQILSITSYLLDLTSYIV